MHQHTSMKCSNIKTVIWTRILPCKCHFFPFEICRIRWLSKQLSAKTDASLSEPGNEELTILQGFFFYFLDAHRQQTLVTNSNYNILHWWGLILFRNSSSQESPTKSTAPGQRFANTTTEVLYNSLSFTHLLQHQWVLLSCKALSTSLGGKRRLASCPMTQTCSTYQATGWYE